MSLPTSKIRYHLTVIFSHLEQTVSLKKVKSRISLGKCIFKLLPKLQTKACSLCCWVREQKMQDHIHPTEILGFTSS